VVHPAAEQRVGKDGAVKTPGEMGNRLKVAQVIYSLEVGGLEKVALSLTRALDENRFESYLISLNGPGPLSSQLSLDPEHCLLLEPQSSSWLPRRPIDCSAVLRIRRFLKDHGIQVVHLHNAGPLVYGGLAARLSLNRPRIIYSEHNQVYRASSRLKRRFRQYLRLADRTIAVSADLQRYLQNDLRVPVAVEVIRNGISVQCPPEAMAASVREELGLRPSDLVIGTAVVLSEQKGLTYLLEAVPAILRDVPNARFVIAGDGPLRAALEEQTRAAGLQQSVSFIGYQKDVARVISAFDVYVLPSLWEGLPLALLEALALGKPIVATTVGGNPEIVQDGVNGLLVPPRDPGALARALAQVCGDERFRHEVANSNRGRFDEQFSLAQMVRAHEQLYESAVKHPATALQRQRLHGTV
jgi:glycosyltransferase involved in cell wall biosynthesis